MLAIVLALGPVSSPLALCLEPAAPSRAPRAPTSADLPEPPSCLESYRYDGRHTCEAYELDSYADAMDSYIDELSAYDREAASFADEASDFANDVRAYAECERDEAVEALGE